MSARLPILQKTPFELDPRPLGEASSPHAGALSISRVFRSLRVPGRIAANLKLRKCRRGFSEGQMIESLVMLQAIGGESPEDIRLINKDPCLEREAWAIGRPKPQRCGNFSICFTMRT